MKQVNFNFFLLCIFVLGFGSALAQETGGGSAAPVVLSGTLQGWDQGEATIAVESSNEDGTFRGTLAEAPVAEDGSFELELPAEVPAELLEEVDASQVCPGGGVTVSSESVQWTLIFGLSVLQDGTSVGNAVLTSSEGVMGPDQESASEGDQGVIHVYSTEPVSVQGTCTESDGNTQTINADLKEGWNALVFTITDVSEGARTLESEVVDEPSGVNWFFIPPWD